MKVLIKNRRIFMKVEGCTMLDKIISEDLIATNVAVKNREEAIRFAGKLLYDAGIVEKRYIEAMISSLNEFGPYIVVTRNIALPHARPEEGAIKPGLSIVTLSTPIPFGNKQNDPVKYIFCLSAVDNDQHIKVMSELAEILDDKHFNRLLETAKDKHEILDYIRERNNWQ